MDTPTASFIASLDPVSRGPTAPIAPAEVARAFVHAIDEALRLGTPGDFARADVLLALLPSNSLEAEVIFTNGIAARQALEARIDYADEPAEVAAARDTIGKARAHLETLAAGKASAFELTHQGRTQEEVSAQRREQAAAVNALANERVGVAAALGAKVSEAVDAVKAALPSLGTIGIVVGVVGVIGAGLVGAYVWRSFK